MFSAFNSCTCQRRDIARIRSAFGDGTCGCVRMSDIVVNSTEQQVEKGKSLNYSREEGV